MIGCHHLAALPPLLQAFSTLPHPVWRGREGGRERERERERERTRTLDNIYSACTLYTTMSCTMFILPIKA